MSNEEYRFGSASWSDESELRRAGLLSARGLQIGYSANKSICLETDAPIITVACAGSGKMRDLLALAVQDLLQDVGGVAHGKLADGII